MSSKLFQNIVNQVKEVINGYIGVVDENGLVVASNDLAMIGTTVENFDISVLRADDQCHVIDGKTYKALSADNSGFDYAAFVEGTGDASVRNCVLISVAFNESKANYNEKHNKAEFVKNIISDNILPGDVYVRAKDLHFVTDDPRCVILVRQKGLCDAASVDSISRLFSDRQNDFVLNINETDIVVIKKLVSSEKLSDALTFAAQIEKQLKDELGITCVIGISTVANHLRELADRYKESQVAIEVGSIFEQDKTIIQYDSLGLGRIIYQLPTTLCEMFLNEVFKMNTIDSLDDDTLETINRFFENNLNVSETSRKLYVHRNTLVYRLEKIKKLTGLDLREFDHAIIFKVAMMVKMYLDSLGKGKNRY